MVYNIIDISLNLTFVMPVSAKKIANYNCNFRHNQGLEIMLSFIIEKKTNN